MKEPVVIFGLGGMGLTMATNLLKAGFGLRVYNRTPDKARPLQEQGAILASSPAEAAEPGRRETAPEGEGTVLAR